MANINKITLPNGTSYDIEASWNNVTSKPTIPTKVSQLTNDTGFITMDDVDTKLSSVMTYKGTVANYTDLPTNAATGDTYNITNASSYNKAGDNAVWNGTTWDVLSGTIDLSNYVEKVSGKGLSTNDYTTTEKNKLAGIASNAQVNVIESIKVNGTAQTVSSKAVNITVPTKVTDLSDATNYLKTADTSAITNAEIDTIIGA